MCTKVYALMLMLFAVVSVYGQDNVIDEVVWVVGDEAILKSDVENERLNAQYEGRKFDGDPYCIIPEQLAIQKLFLHQAAIDSIEVSEQEIISDVERRTNWLIDQIGSKEKVEEYYNKNNANPHRGTYDLSIDSTEEYDKARRKVAEFINAKRPEEIVFTKNATEALNLIANSYGLENLQKDDSVVISIMEHHSNIVPWQKVTKLKEAKLEYLLSLIHISEPTRRS